MCTKMATTDDSMDDDVFESDDELRGRLAVSQRQALSKTPSPTGYRGYQPPPEVLKLAENDILEDTEQKTHKTILLGDSGVGKTSLLVKFDTGKFQSGNFSATVGIGFTYMSVQRPNLSDVRLHPDRCALALHATKMGHHFDFDNFKLLDIAGNYQKIIFLEMCHINDNDNNELKVVKVTKACCISDEDDKYASITGTDNRETKSLDFNLHYNYELWDPYLMRKELLKNSQFDYDIFVRIMLLGDSGVGKTCLLTQFKDDHFLSGNYISTIGVDFRNKIVNVDQTRIKLQIWDTAGQERFRSITHAYYRDAHALLLLYDVTNKTSFDNIRAWLGEIREYAQGDVVIMLLGNKADCGPLRAIRREEGERLAREYNVCFMETSAKSGQNVDLAFLAVARELKYRQTGEQDQNRISIQDYTKEQSHKSQCPPCGS